MQTLSSIRYECTYPSSIPCSRNSQPPGAARPIRSDTFLSRGGVACRLRGIDERRYTCEQVGFDLESRRFGNTRGQRHQSEFWKRREGIEQHTNLDPDQYRHGGGHDFSGDRHWRGFQRRGRNVFDFHSRRAEPKLPDPICSDGRRKRFWHCFHNQRCNEFYPCDLSQRYEHDGAGHHRAAGKPVGCGR